MTISLPIALDYNALASAEIVESTANALRARGVKVQIVDTAAQALAKVHEIIPSGATVMSGLSQTLRDIGLEEQFINKQHLWNNLKDEIVAEADPAKQHHLRVKAALSPWYLGSVQAIAQTGEIVVASGTGSQLASYAYTSPNLLWIVGTQKIVPTLEDGIRRIREHSLQLEHIRMKAMGYPGAMLAKLLIIEHEPPPPMGRNVNLILLNERVGA